MTKWAGYNTSRTASHRDLSWHPFQHLHLWPANHCLQKVCICWRPSNHACWWRLAGSGCWTRTSQPQQQNHALLFWAQLPRSNIGQVAHILLTLCVTLQEADVAFLRQLTGFGWGAGATILRTATLSLVHSTAEYCTPSGAAVLTPTLLTLPSTTPCKLWLDACGLLSLLRRNGATLSVACRAMEPGHLLYSVLTCPSCADARRLISRHPFVPAAQQLISPSDNNNIRVAQLVGHQWNAEWETPPHFHPRHQHPSPRSNPPKKSLGLA